MTIGHTYRVNTRGTARQQRVQFGLHLRQDGATGDPTTLASHWITNIVPLVIAATSVEVNWNDVQVADTSPSGDATVIAGITQPAPGTQTGEMLPTQNAIVVQLRSAQKGRRTRGRFYLPGISELNHAGGVVTGTQQSAVSSLAAALLTFYGPTGSQGSFHLVIYSPIQLTAPAPRPFKPKETELVTPVNSLVMDTTVRTQRRRAIGVGR
jgi:hypothetical protein